MLKFIGSGSAFNTKLGNTSAYCKKDNQLLLIDCGSNVFQRIKENNILEGIEHVYALVTHAHADHVGSLADLIFYTYYSLGEFAKNKITIISPSDTKVNDLLSINGCVEGLHFSRKILPITMDIEIESMDMYICFAPTVHVEYISSYRIALRIGRYSNSVRILYSGDATGTYFYNKETLIEKLETFDIFYVDTCKADYVGNPHLSLRELTELIPEEYRHKIWCMHLDEGFDREEAEALGFNVVVNEFK